MRDIKFQYGFLKDDKSYVKKVYHLSEIPHIREKCDVWDMLPISFVRQFTGVKDSEGKDVYEGDVIEYDNGTKAEVIFKDGGFCGYDGWANSSDEAYLKIDSTISGPFNEKDFEIKVIGNIYENPELLEE